MSDHPDPGALSESKFSEMVSGAIAAHGIEQVIRATLEKVAGSNNGRPGPVIVGPGGQGVRLNVPSAQELALLTLNGTLVALQTVRIVLVALNDMDTRLRMQDQAARKAPAGSVVRLRPDTPGKPAPTTTGTGPAETQGGREAAGKSGTEPVSQGSPNR